MNWFFKKKKLERRGWEEITTPKNIEDNKEDCGVEEASEDDAICEDENQSENTSESQEEDRSFVNPPERSESKFTKRVENLDFDPTVYFGWGDGKVDNFMQKMTNGWNVLASIMWFVFGSFTFAPVLFTANKLDKFFDDKTKSLVVSAIIYFIFIVALVLFLFLR